MDGSNITSETKKNLSNRHTITKVIMYVIYKHFTRNWPIILNGLNAVMTQKLSHKTEM